MKKTLLLFALIWAIGVNAQDVSREEREALINFYHSTNGDNWNNNEKWLSDAPVREWAGISTIIDDNDNEFVSHIEFFDDSGNGLVGNVVLENLPKLEKLILRHNNLGSVKLKNLPLLDRIDLINNRITSIELTNLPELQFLALDANRFTTIHLDNFPKLTYINLPNNKLSSINLSNLPKLGILNLMKNQFTSITLKSLPNIQWIDLDDNQLTDVNFDDLSTLQSLELNHNHLTKINLDKLKNLGWLEVSHNKLSSIDVSGLSHLQELILNDNPINTKVDLNQHNYLTKLILTNTDIPVVSLKGYNYYANQEFHISDKVKCIEVDNPKAQIEWNITWASGYENNYRTDCNEYLSTTEIGVFSNDIKVVSPTTNILVLQGDSKVNKIEIYNTAGQLIKVLNSHQRDISDLSKGIYLLKINTDKGTTIQKVIK